MTKAVDEFINNADRRFAAQQKLIDRQHEQLATLAAGHARQNERIAALEAELARVHANGHQVEAPVEHKPGADVWGGRDVEPEQGASVTAIEPTSPHMPSKSELRRLQQITASRYPVFANVDEDHFAKCFRFIRSCSRTAKLDTQHDLGYWLEEAASYCKCHELTGRALCAAIIASGDVQFSDPSRMPYVSFALHRHGPNYGKTAWKDLLSGGGMLAPIPAAPLDRSIGVQRVTAIG